MSDPVISDSVKEYYGKILQKSSDLKTNACCTAEKYPRYVLDKLKSIHPDVLSSYYGCGLVMPDSLEGCRVIDLGCGTGRDVYLLSQFVGKDGEVVGVDMTDTQIKRAKSFLSYHSEVCPSVDFKHGYIEHLDELDLSPNYFDIVVSNCVVNLSPDKEAVLRQVFNLLKEGGEFYFSDVYCSKRIPNELLNDPVLWGECLAGALYWNDFINMAKKCGFIDPRLVKSNVINIRNKEIREKLGDIEFYSATYRLFKLPDILEPDCEDYGQAVIYKGTIPYNKHNWILDNHHTMITDKVFPVCGNTWNMLRYSRFSDHFEFIGDFNNHYGIFDGCGKQIPFTNEPSCC